MRKVSFLPSAELQKERLGDRADVHGTPVNLAVQSHIQLFEIGRIGAAETYFALVHPLARTGKTA